jgi:hypothetical protein
VKLRLSWLIGVCALLCARPAAATSLSVIPAAGAVNVNDRFLVNIEIDNVDDLFSWQFDFAFDPTLLRAESVVEGDFLSSGGETFFIEGAIALDAANTQTGSIDFIASTLLGNDHASGGGILATIAFVSLAQGISALDLLNVVLLDGANLAPIANTVSGGSIESFSTVPEPGTLLLVATGLAAVWRGRRRLDRAQRSRAARGGIF